MNKREIGNFGENMACRYLTKKGVKILERNYRVRAGEIDIIGLDENILVFYEVKTRSNNIYGTPAESVNYYKQMHIKNVALEFMSRARPKFKGMRFDIIEVNLDDDLKFKNIHQIVNAF